MRLRHGSILALLVCGFLTTAPRAEQTGPVALFTPALITPREVAGTGVAPHVTVDVVIDATGKVSDVTVRTIEPSTEFDALFEATTRETLLRWRYAPATEDDAPTEARLSWIVQFAEVDAVDAESASADFVWGRVGPRELLADDERRRILAMPLERRTQMLASYAKIARDLLDPATTKRINSTRFMVFTDAPDAKVAEVLASNLEATFNILRDLLGERVDPQPEPYRVVVFLYKSEAEFSELRDRISGLEWASGIYHAVGLLAFHLQMPSNEALLSIMLHEATHAYLDRYVTRPGVVLPRWLDEGFCEYVGNSQIKKGKLVPGRTRRSEGYQGPLGKIRGVSIPRLSVDEVRAAIKENRALTLERILTTAIEEFYGADRGLYYAQSWLLIHFLRHGREAWTDEDFADLMLYAAEGYPPLRAFRKVYGEPAALDEAYRTYVRKF